jgi:hypothetical protein
MLRTPSSTLSAGLRAGRTHRKVRREQDEADLVGDGVVGAVRTNLLAGAQAVGAWHTPSDSNHTPESFCPTQPWLESTHRDERMESFPRWRARP